jgi:hypothetical protein
MFNVFNDMFDEIPHTLSANYLLTYSRINQNLLRNICNFISIFDDVIEQLSVDTRPTLHLVVPLRQHLIDHCSVFDGEDDLIHIKNFISTYQL